MQRLIDLHHPLARAVTTSIRKLRHIESRLPLLLAVIDEAKRMSAGPPTARNSFVARMFTDSFDMLVIDLCSLREREGKRGGVLRRLKLHTPLLRRLRPEDFDVEWARVEAWSREAQEDALAAEQAKLVLQFNVHFDWLFPNGDPVRHEDIDALIARFLADTEPTNADRNKARAHRYEERPEVAARFVQTPEQIQQQVQVFKRYFGSLFATLTGATYPLDDPPPTGDDVEGTAQDIADMITLGSINEATFHYGLGGGEHDTESRYWYRRKQFFDAGGKVT